MFAALLAWLGLSCSPSSSTRPSTTPHGDVSPSSPHRRREGVARRPSPRDLCGQLVYYVQEEDYARKGHAIDGH